MAEQNCLICGRVCNVEDFGAQSGPDICLNCERDLDEYDDLLETTNQYPIKEDNL